MLNNGEGLNGRAACKSNQDSPFPAVSSERALWRQDGCQEDEGSRAQQEHRIAARGSRAHVPPRRLRWLVTDVIWRQKPWDFAWIYFLSNIGYSFNGEHFWMHCLINNICSKTDFSFFTKTSIIYRIYRLNSQEKPPTTPPPIPLPPPQITEKSHQPTSGFETVVTAFVKVDPFLYAARVSHTIVLKHKEERRRRRDDRNPTSLKLRSQQCATYFVDEQRLWGEGSSFFLWRPWGKLKGGGRRGGNKEHKWFQFFFFNPIHFQRDANLHFSTLLQHIITDQ